MPAAFYLGTVVTGKIATRVIPSNCTAASINQALPNETMPPVHILSCLVTRGRHSSVDLCLDLEFSHRPKPSRRLEVNRLTQEI